MRIWKANAAVTLVGSMPHTDRQKVIDFILDEMVEVPVWPQLSRFRPEQMMVQYLEGLPGLVEEDGKLFIDTTSSQFEDELLAFYEDYLDLESDGERLMESRFRMGSETARTFFQFIDTLKARSFSRKGVKGQIVGPFTLLTGLKNEAGRALVYDERYQDVVRKHLAMKAKWQIECLKSLGFPVILFIDEPALAGFGSSAFISISRELIQELLKEVVDAVQQAGALAGVHICANTDWNLAFDSGVDIVNFDSYNYMEKFILYKNAFAKFISNNGVIAWGVVPTSDADEIAGQTANELTERWRQDVAPFIESGISLKNILQQSIFTPSCGCSGLPEDAAEKVVVLTREVGEMMRNMLDA